MAISCEHKLKQALEIAIRRYGADKELHPKTMSTLQNLLSDLSDIKKARAAYLKYRNAKKELDNAKKTSLDKVTLLGKQYGEDAPLFSDLFSYDKSSLFLGKDFTLDPSNKEGVFLDTRLQHFYEMGNDVLSTVMTKAIQNKGKKLTDKSVVNMITDNPAFNLLLRKGTDGYEINPNIATAVSMGAIKGLTSNLSALSNYKSDDEIYDTVNGLPLNMPIPEEVERKLRNGGIGADILAESLGKEIASTIGIYSKNSSSISEYNRLTTGLGSLALLMLSDPKVGILKPLDGTATNEEIIKGGKGLESKIQAYKDNPTVINTSEFMSDVDGNQKVFIQRYAVLVDDDNIRENIYNITSNNTKLIDAFLNSSSNLREPSFTKPEDRPVSIRKQAFTEASKEQVRVLNKLEKVPYEFNEGVDVLFELIDDMDGDRQSVLQSLLGYKEINEESSFDAQEAAKSKNRGIAKVVNDFLSFYDKVKNSPDENGNDKAFYFNWFIGRNDRTYLDSNTINPQTDKELARWLVNAKDNAYDVNMEELASTFDKELSVADIRALSDQTKVFVLGTVAAFEGSEINGFEIVDPEKATASEVFKSFDALVHADDNVLNELALNGKGHVGFKAIALAGLRNAKVGKDFKTNVPFESDGKTNGLAHKYMQMPYYENMDRKLRQIGVVQNTFDESKYGSLTDLNADKKDFDAYQEIGMVFHNTLLEKYFSLDDFGKDILSSGLIIELENREVTNVNEISKSIRDYAKGPAVEAMYGASVETLSNNKVKEAMAKIFDGIADKSLKITPAIKSWIEDAGWEVKDLRKALQENSLASSEFFKLKASLKETLEVIVKEPMKASIEHFYGGYIQLNDSINLAMNNMYALFSAIYDKEIEKLGGSTNITFEQQVQLINRIVKTVPGVRKISSLSDNDRILLIKRGLGKVNYDDTRNEVFTVASNFIPDATSDPVRNRAVNLMLNILGPTIKGPEASAGPIITHHRDNQDIMGTWEKTYDKTGKSFIPVFDAEVINGDTFSAIKDMNQSFYEGSRDYNFIHEIKTSIDDAIQFVEENYGNEAQELINNAIAPSKNNKYLTIVGSLMDIESIEKQLVTNRKNLYNSTSYVGQMAGIAGTMYVVDGKKELGNITNSVKEKAKAVSNLLANDKPIGVTLLKDKAFSSALNRLMTSEPTYDDAKEVIDTIKEFDFLDNDNLESALFDMNKNITGYMTLTGQSAPVRTNIGKYQYKVKPESSVNKADAKSAQFCRE